MYTDEQLANALQEIVDELKEAQDNGWDTSEIIRIWLYQKTFIKRLTGKNVTFKNWKVVIE